MVGIMNPVSREKLSRLSNSVKLAIDLASKLDLCRQLKQDLLEEDAAALSEFLPRLFDLYSDPSGPVRKLATEYAPLKSLPPSHYISCFIANKLKYICFLF